MTAIAPWNASVTGAGGQPSGPIPRFASPVSFEAALADAEASLGTTGLEAELAQLFNEHGFFPANDAPALAPPQSAHDICPAGTSSALPRFRASGAPEGELAAATESPALAEPDAPPVESPELFGAGERRVAPLTGSVAQASTPAGPGSGSPLSATGASERALQRAAQPRPAPAGRELGDRPAAGPPSSPARPARGDRFTFALGAHGIELAARAERLTPEDEARLIDAVAALLGRHGFSLSEARINGKPAAAGAFMRNG